MRPAQFFRSASIALLALAWPRGVSAENTLPRLLLGGADRVFDILGVSPGMPCADAKAVVQRGYAAKNPGNFNRLVEGGRWRDAHVGNAPKSMKVISVVQRLIDQDHDEDFRFECSSKESRSEVYYVQRSWKFHIKNPNIDEQKLSLEKKYGSFPSTFRQRDRQTAVFGIFYNRAGRILETSDACGRFFHNTPEGAISHITNKIDLNECSFALYAIFELKPGTRDEVDKITVSIWDYMRLAKLFELDELVNKKIRASEPVKAPKW